MRLTTTIFEPRRGIGGARFDSKSLTRNGCGRVRFACWTSGRCGRWPRLGVLLQRAEQAGYDLLITTDQNLRYQQNLIGRQIAILVLRTTSWPRIRQQVDLVLDAVATTTAGSYRELSFAPSP